MNNSSKKLGVILAVIVVIVAAVIINTNVRKPQQTAWTSYHERVYGFDVKYPSTWQIQDNMNKDGCCLFIVNVEVSTTTSTNASGTPMTSVTAKEPVRIQLGYYYRASLFDPFKMATNTPITLGTNSAFTGVSNNTPYYLIPMTSIDGIGASYFTSLDNTDATGTRQAVESILSTLVFTGTSTATSTAQ